MTDWAREEATASMKRVGLLPIYNNKPLHESIIQALLAAEARGKEAGIEEERHRGHDAEWHKSCRLCKIEQKTGKPA